MKKDRLERVERLIEQIAIEIRELKESQKKTDEQLRKTDAEIREFRELQREAFKKTDKQIEETSRLVARLTDSWGRFVEGMVSPSVAEFIRKKGFRDIKVYHRLKVSKDGKNAEYDTIVESPSAKLVVLASAKSHVSSRDVDELLRDMEKFEFFMGDKFKGYTLLGAIAGMSFGRGADTYAKRKGIIVFKVSGDVTHAEEPKRLKQIKILNTYQKT